MGRVANRLHPNRVKALKEPGHYVDGDGLALVIGKRGGKSWVLRTVIKGKRTDIGLGGVSWVSLAEAREKARELRKIAREGGDPRAVRRAEEECPTFEEAAKRVHAEQIAGQGKNDKHRAQWLNTLKAYAFPLIGTKPVREIEQRDVLAVLAPIWTEKPETARRVRQRIRTVMNWARTAGHFEGVNPVVGVEKGLERQKRRVTHHAAMPWAEIPDFLPRLGDSAAALALRFLILTAARTGEVIGARWSEIDTEARVWTIPAERMKAEKEHRPLAEALPGAAGETEQGPFQHGDGEGARADRPGRRDRAWLPFELPGRRAKQYLRCRTPFGEGNDIRYPRWHRADTRRCARGRA